MASDEIRPYVSHNLGLLAYPVGTRPSSEPGDHIMAATALSWLCDLPVGRWGEPWAVGGTIDLRFRSHLDAGLDVELVGEHDADGIDLAIRSAAAHDDRNDDRRDNRFVSGRAAAAGDAPITMPRGSGPDSPVDLTPTALDGLVLRPVTFAFDAGRDLRMADHLQGGAFWLDRGWAHPGWFATAANAVAAGSIAFDPPAWMYVGVRIDLHAPVTDGTALVIGGRVAELFESRRHRFAVCDLAVHADRVPVVSLRTTFIYGTVRAS